ncbi:putative leucine-rich repeat-containing protein DDB_G0290503 isoform X2 [Leptopilina heterotoma]|uniref:putative leucine-rich repeat-containing protein DDB_G0290503 isoform X2 n=1 Tax=Leptopilina heterotoma TaxID=63436 RepID=UPI001CA9BCDE|nr:putative leucine-rich repeat-containing protein DDB_G0290503 isoform X2 [Leptopilina heterotoma]
MDKEKLCAARKKLKQYQTFKKDIGGKHKDTENTNNEHARITNRPRENNPLKYNTINLEMENNANSNFSPEKDELNKNSSEFTSVNTNYIEKCSNTTEQSNSNSSTINVIRDENIINDLQSFQCAVNKESAPVTQSNNCEFIESEDINSSNATSKQSDFEDRNFSSNLSDSSVLQKENLLQMASSVAQVLINDQDLSKTSEVNNLTDKNQFLTNCLQEQANLISELHGQVSRYSSRISEMEAIIAANEANYASRIMQEVNPLKHQIELHTHTTGLLVAEKAELKATVDKCYETIKEKKDIIEDLSKKLKSSQLELTVHEKESTSYKNNNEERNKAYNLMQQSYEKLMDECLNLRKDKESLELECSELKQKLNLSNTNLSTINQELQEKNAMLALNEIKIRQLITTSDQVQSLENDRQTVAVYEQQLAQLKVTLTALNNEKDEANKQYKSYLEQAEERLKFVKSQLIESNNNIQEFEIREKDYVRKIREMEEQLHHEKERVECFKPQLEHKVELLTKNIDNLVIEQESLQLSLNQKDSEIEMLNKELQELHNIKKYAMDASALATALESEQLGASRAIHQNQQLKHQIDEMHDAFVLLSNNKLDLTEQLQSERNLCKQLNIKVSEYEATCQELKSQLNEKNAALTDVEKGNFLNEDLRFKMPISSESNQSEVLEFQNAKSLIEILQKENNQLKEELNLQSKKLTTEQMENIETISNHKTTFHNESALNSSVISETDLHETEKCMMTEFITKLESRFKETMDKNAELIDEKQKLEHLVLQLQEETETIGEYIALYQKQRSVLQGKAQERELTFRQIAQQRDYQQEQIQKLKFLISKLLKTKQNAIENSLEATENMQICSETKGQENVYNI